MKEAKIKESKTLNELLDELEINPVLFLIGINRHILHLKEIQNKRFHKVDIVTLIRLIDGG